MMTMIIDNMTYREMEDDFQEETRERERERDLERERERLTISG